MQKDLSHYRKDYIKTELSEKQVDKHPMQQFQIWFQEADAAMHQEEANAMTLSTYGKDGFPKSRVVLLKKYTPDGFVFYTNYNSEKGQAILHQPKVCLSFFWGLLERQVIVKGTAEKTSEEDAETYFHSRPRGSQLGALASNQSSVIASRDVLEAQLKQLEETYGESQTIPKPKNWGGFLVRPVSVEFWQGRSNRLHDRVRYTLHNKKDWKIERLAP